MDDDSTQVEYLLGKTESVLHTSTWYLDEMVAFGLCNMPYIGPFYTKHKITYMPFA